MLFQESGESFLWIDADGSGGLSAGDAVDLDGDLIADAGESLAYLEADNTDQYGNVPGAYSMAFDFLYNDADGDLQRDFGPRLSGRTIRPMASASSSPTT